MAKSIPAIVQPRVLAWARNSAGYSLDEAAKKLQTSRDKLEAWESGTKPPSIAKVRKMVTVYKRPLHVFFLDEPPDDPPIPHDFRRLPVDRLVHYEPALRFQVRAAYERRQIALDLAGDLDVKPARFGLTGSIGEDAEALSERVRSFLAVSVPEQQRMHRPGDNYRFWRSSLEAKDVLVFQFTGVRPKQMLGFSLSFDVLPVIAVNRKLKPNGRVFTLLHELTHLIVRESGICDLAEDHLGSPADQRTEVFANRLAAAVLLPKPAFLAETIVTKRGGGQHEWSNDELESLANAYGVSEETVLRRLLTLGRTTQRFYKRAEYQARYEQLEEQGREALDQDEFKRNRPQEVISDFGRFFTRLVLANYSQDRISLTDASKFLGVKAPMVEKVERLLLART
jgi:Zn-dependent peptidase ImmA (M78 family)/transcriptional regulator with XRE-family HTH domain